LITNCYECALEKIEATLAESREFFALHQEVKMKYQKKDDVTNFHGFTGPADEMCITQKRKLKNDNFVTHLHFLNSLNENDKSAAEPKESFHFWGPEAFKKSSCPSEIPSLKDSIDSYRESLAPLARKILRALAFFLDLQDIATQSIPRGQFHLIRQCSSDELLLT
jgi:isopenicillin N synthase-like dioxygenase